VRMSVWGRKKRRLGDSVLFRRRFGGDGAGATGAVRGVRPRIIWPGGRRRGCGGMFFFIRILGGGRFTDKLVPPENQSRGQIAGGYVRIAGRTRKQVPFVKEQPGGVGPKTQPNDRARGVNRWNEKNNILPPARE